ncbi:MAG: STAS domain-containing protein [Brevibacillus sp.]|nr:STAS domain-containing protein [Brevibacillus sp.]
MESNKGMKKVKDSDLTLDRLASIGQIAAGIAHEIKNPLTAVKGFLQMLRKELSHNYLDLAYSELDNALSTLQNLLHVSKPDLENEPFTAINLCSELEALLYLFQDKFYDVHIETHFSNTNEKIYGKRNQLKKAFFNLLKNAFEAIPDKGTITIKHYKSNNGLIVSISDTGIGIPQEKIALLGTPFFTSKTEGTGMGLTQVFSTIYGHDGKITVNSEEGVGTTFTIWFPIHEHEKIGVKKLDLKYMEGQNFSAFYTENKDKFDELLIYHGKELFESIQNSTDVNEEFLLKSAGKIVTLLNYTDEYGLILNAKEDGRNWAKYDMDIILILEWFQTLRKIYWDFLYNYYQHLEIGKNEFFELERRVNYNLDSYLKHFSASFSEYKNELLRSQRSVIDDLTVPVIPLSDTMAILPIIGTVDTHRAKKIQEKIFDQIYQLKLKHIILDLSGVAYMDTAIVGHLFKIVNGISIQGCKATITGIRPEITNTMVELGIALHEKVETRGTLQQAIEEYNHNRVG